MPAQVQVPISLDAWLEHYRHAWETADVDEITSIFAEDGTYRREIFDEPHRGHAGIAAYWRNVSAAQKNVKVRLGVPVVGTDRVAVEWWATMSDPDEGDVTVPGVLLLRFDADGRCRELQEYYMTRPGWAGPPSGWAGRT